MAFASLCAEHRVRDRMQLLGISTTIIAKLAGIPQTRVSLAMRELQDFSEADAETLLTLTAKLVEISDAFAPLPLDMSHPEKIRALLRHMETSAISLADIRGIVATVFGNTIVSP
jgi:hypothetical protein